MLNILHKSFIRTTLCLLIHLLLLSFYQLLCSVFFHHFSPSFHHFLFPSSLSLSVCRRQKQNYTVYRVFQEYLRLKNGFFSITIHLFISPEVIKGNSAMLTAISFACRKATKFITAHNVYHHNNFVFCFVVFFSFLVLSSNGKRNIRFHLKSTATTQCHAVANVICVLCNFRKVCNKVG